MAAAPPHLLTLPRELRDNIYGNLSRPITAPWAWKKWESGEEEYDVYDIVDVHFDNHPYHSVLLTHSRLTEEYKESGCFKDLTATITIEMSKCNVRVPVQDRTKEKSANMSKIQKQVQDALAHVKHATLIIKHTPLDSNAGNQFHGLDNNIFFDTLYLSEFLSALEQAMQNIKSLRIALHRPHADLIEDEHLADWTQLDVRDSKPVFIPSEDFGSLKMHQSGEGYIVGFGRNWMNFQLPGFWPTYMFAAGPPAAQAIYSVDGQDFGLSHEVHRVSVYTYCRENDDRPDKKFWTEDSVMKMLEEECGVKMHMYPAQVLNNVGVMKKEELERFSGGLTGWEECRGPKEIEARRASEESEDGE